MGCIISHMNQATLRGAGGEDRQRDWVYDTSPPSDRLLYLVLTQLHGLSPRANYTGRETAACRRSNCQLLRIEGAMWSAWRIPRPYSRFSRQEPLLFYHVASQLYSRG
jgi:hypothetical protein